MSFHSFIHSFIHSFMSMMPVHNPTNYMRKEEDGKLLPVWITLPLAKDVLNLDVKCTCKSTCTVCLPELGAVT